MVFYNDQAKKLPKNILNNVAQQKRLKTRIVILDQEVKALMKDLELLIDEISKWHTLKNYKKSYQTAGGIVF